MPALQLTEWGTHACNSLPLSHSLSLPDRWRGCAREGEREKEGGEIEREIGREREREKEGGKERKRKGEREKESEKERERKRGRENCYFFF